jgi:hypothetical protein
MKKIIVAVTLLCLSVAANAETYVCSSSNSDNLYTFKRDGLQFARDGYGTTYFEINGENDRWLFLSNAQLGDDDYFQFIVVAINKQTMDYFVGTSSSIYIPGIEERYTGGKCTRL